MEKKIVIKIQEEGSSFVATFTIPGAAIQYVELLSPRKATIWTEEVVL